MFFYYFALTEAL